MNMDPVLLMAYVDGELTPEQMRAVDAEMARSPQVGSYVADLMASKLPYQLAFAEQKLPPVPASLSASVAALAHAHAASPRPAPAAANDQAGSAPSAAAVAAAPIRSPLRVAPAWLGAAFAAGIVCCAVGVAWLAPSGAGVQLAAVAPGASVATWVAAAAGYQQLYSRETVAPLVADANASASTVAAIRRDDGLAIRIPDLTTDGFEFKRVQRLRFHGKPLVQIVYLPKQGEPIALCVMAEAGKADHAVAAQDIAGMKVVTWRDKQLGYALIGNGQGADLMALAKRIDGNQVGPLFDGTQLGAVAGAGWLVAAR